MVQTLFKQEPPITNLPAPSKGKALCFGDHWWHLWPTEMMRRMLQLRGLIESGGSKALSASLMCPICVLTGMIKPEMFGIIVLGLNEVREQSLEGTGQPCPSCWNSCPFLNNTKKRSLHKLLFSDSLLDQYSNRRDTGSSYFQNIRGEKPSI